MLSDNDLELLSAYIDGALGESERAVLETRLAADAELRRELARLRATVELVNSLPPLAAPRDFTLPPRMVRRPPTILTSAAFSALSAAAAIMLLVVGAALFASSVRLPANNLNSNAVAFAPTTASQTAQDGLQAEVYEAAREQVEDASVLASPSPEPTQMIPATQPAQESPADILLAPTGTFDVMQYAAPESATLAEEQDDFAGAAAADAVENQQQDGEGALAMQSTGADQTASAELRFDEPSQPPPSGAGGITEAQPPAPGEAPLAAQAPPETTTPAPTLAPTGTPTLTPSATPSLTATATMTAPPTLAPSLTPTPTPQPIIFGDFGSAGIGLIVVALVLLAAAVVTTILRRRR